MDLRMTVIEDGAAARFRLTGPDTASGQDVADLLARHLGHPGPWTLAGRPLEDCSPGVAPFLGEVVVEQAPSSTGGRPRSTATGLVLTVLEGPSCGRQWPLPRGTWTVGKGDGADITIADASLQPLTAGLCVGTDSVRLLPASGRAVRCGLGLPFRLGDTVLRLDQGCTPPSQTVPPLRDPEAVRFLPQGSGWTTLLLSAGLPVLAGGLLAWLLDWWLVLVFSGMSAVMAIGHWFARGSSTSRNRRLLVEAGAAECARVEAAAPSLGTLWAETPNFPVGGSEPPSGSGSGLPIRWGRGSRCPHVLADGEVPGSSLHLADAPVATDAALPHLLSVPESVVDAAVAGLLLRGARLAVRSCGDRPLLSPEWLVHPRISLLAPSEAAPEDTVVLQDAVTAPEVLRPRHIYLFRGSLPETNRCSPCVRVEHRSGRLHVETTGLTASDARAPGILPGRPATDVVPDGLAPGARPSLLARATDPSLSSGPGAGPSLFSSVAELASETARERWRRSEDCGALVADFGTDPRSGQSVLVDFNQDGPHCVIGGTTGSGKSEFFRSLLLSLALRYGPRRLGFVLIDFKGAAGFGPLARLPHVHRLITDLDEAAVHRDLAFLQAELVRREKLLRRWGVADWHEHQALRRIDPAAAAEPPLPELMICVDEFRMLVEALPEAMTRLLRIATVGRSLGIHLVMSTQRPQGAISADIRANVSLTVCLRVASEADSSSLLGSDCAARIPAGARGRGFLLRDGDLQEFQGRLADDLPRPVPARPILEVLPPPVTGPPEPSRETDSESGNGNRLELGIRRWIQTLPPSECDAPAPIIPPDLGQCADRIPQEVGRLPARVQLGSAESPADGWQGPLVWSPEEHGPLSLMGSLEDQRRWTRHLLAVASQQGFSVLAVVSDRGCADFLNDHGGPVLLGVLPSEDPEFLVEGLRAAKEDPRMPERVLVLVQGADRVVEDLMRNGLAGEQLLEDLVVAVGRRWAVSMTTVSSMPRSLRGLGRTTIHWGAAARDDYALAHPRTGRDLNRRLALVEGALAPGAGPCGLLVRGPDDSALPAENRTSGRAAGPGVRFRPFPRELVWSAPDPTAPPPEGIEDGGPWPLLVGAGSPFLEECFLPVRRGEIVGVAGDSVDCARLLTALRRFNPWAEFSVHGETEDFSRRSPSRPRIAVLPSAHSLLPGDQDAVDRFLRAADAALVMFDPQRLLVARTPWAEDLRRAGHAVVLGQRTGVEAGFRTETCPKSFGAPTEGAGLLLSPAGSTRFVVATPESQRRGRSEKRSGARCADVVREKSRATTTRP